MLYITAKSAPRYPLALTRPLTALDGYLALGMPREARAELAAVPEAFCHLQPTLRARIRLLLHEKKWRQAGRLAREGLRQYPQECEFMVQRAFALHQQQREREAIEVLQNAPDWLLRTGILHYNLACYEARLGDLGTARECIRAACDLNAAFRKNARKDPDLHRLWN